MYLLKKIIKIILFFTSFSLCIPIVKDIKLNERIDSILNNKIDNIQIGQIEIYDPTTGTIKPLQDVINDLYSLTNKDGLTASEFDALELTATSFDAYQITAYQFDSEGKTILV
jgi:hypothetical protein